MLLQHSREVIPPHVSCRAKGAAVVPVEAIIGHYRSMSKELAGENEDDPVPAGQDTLHHITRAVFICSGHDGKTFLSCKKTVNSQFRLLHFSVCILNVRRRLPMFSLPLQQLGFLSEGE